MLILFTNCSANWTNTSGSLILNNSLHFAALAHSTHFDAYNLFFYVYKDDKKNTLFRLLFVLTRKNIDKSHLCEFCRSVDCYV